MVHKMIPVVILTALVGCKSNDPNGDPPTELAGANLARFADCADMKSYIADAWLEQVVQARYGYGYGYDVALSGGVPESANADDGGSGDGPSDFSETNVQEAGVDEPDIVKTDGNHIYVLQQSRSELTVVSSWPVADAEVVGRVDIAGYPQSMFLKGDRIAVFSQVHNHQGEYGNDSVELPFRDGFATRVTLVNIADRSNPQIERTIDLEGSMSSARLIDSDLYVVLDSWAWVPTEVWELTWEENIGLPEPKWDGSEDEQAAQRAEARKILRPLIEEIVDDTSVDDLLPNQFDQRGSPSSEATPLLACGDIYHPDGVSPPAVLSMAHLDLGRNDSDVSATGVMASGWTVYASKENLYVAQSSRWWWWGWGNLDLNTHIHRFTLDGAESVYAASGEVGGWLWSQFAMSEHEDHLRVATTDQDWWWGAGSEEQGGNNVFVLNQDLAPVGEVTGFAPGEQIFASRFLGDEGYVITFRQIDPLFTFDLSDPKNPRIMGELKMPGFSNYLHPYGDGRLIGVGMDGDDDGNIRGLAINLFDVSDLRVPKLLDQVIVNSDDWSWSESLWNHHAFTLHRDVLNLPIYTYDWDEQSGDWSGFSGMMSISVSESDLSEIGRVGHKDLIDDSECLHAWYDYGNGNACNDHYWYAWMRRSVVVEDNLFSISDYGIKVTDLNAPSDEIARVLFWPENTSGQ